MTTTEVVEPQKKRASRSSTALEGAEITISGLQPTRKALNRVLSMEGEMFDKKCHDALQRKSTAETKLLRCTLDYLTYAKASDIKSGADANITLPTKRKRTASVGPKIPKKTSKKADAPPLATKEEEPVTRLSYYGTVDGWFSRLACVLMSFLWTGGRGRR
jgi:hypothetical protein